MDYSVSLVQTYLHVNGYFTVAEYPIVEATRTGGIRTATDLDILAFRFAGAGRRLHMDRRRARAQHRFESDPELGVSNDRSDMIIGEVKEGRAELNKGARDPFVVRSALVRFGCCASQEVDAVVRQLQARGRAVTPGGHSIRTVVFAAGRGNPRGVDRVVLLGHVFSYLEGYIKEHWEIFRHVQIKDPAFAYLTTREKALGGAVGRARKSPSDDDSTASARGARTSGGIPR